MSDFRSAIEGTAAGVVLLHGDGWLTEHTGGVQRRHVPGALNLEAVPRGGALSELQGRAELFGPNPTKGSEGERRSVRSHASLRL